MAVLTISSRKGGCGKTMLSTALAALLAGDGADVAVLDADPNGTAGCWAYGTDDGPSIQAISEADAERLADLLPLLTDRHGVVIVDAAGFGNRAATVAAAAADSVLVPVTPGEGDMIEAQRTVTYVEGRGRSIRRPIPARVVASRMRRGTTLSRHVLAELDRLELPRLRKVLSEAVANGEIGFSGTLPKDGTAADELAGLVTELRDAGLAT